MKKILMGVILTLMVFTFAGCGLKQNNGPINEPKTQKEEIKGNCKVRDCINKLEITDTLEDVNKKMGFEGTYVRGTEGSYNTYKWEVTSDSYVEVTFYVSSGKADIKIDFNKEEVANSKVDLSKYDDMKSLVQKGEMTYDKFVEMIGGVDGVLVEKGSFSNKYLWYNSSSNYLNGSFSTSSNKCTFVSGMRK